jgi:hydrogenase maturation factor
MGESTRGPESTPLLAGKLPTELLGRLITAYGTGPDPDVIVAPGVGRDAAAIAIDGQVLAVKSDPITFATVNAARYLVAVNANDVACIGATPRWMTVVGLFPAGKTTATDVETLFAELRDVCLEQGISLIGGHTEITAGIDHPLLIGTLLAQATRERLLEPGGAREGDEILVTKSVGLEGTALLASEKRAELLPVLGEERLREARKLLFRPGISIVADARAALDGEGVHALHDPTEGGIATGIWELAQVSGRGAEVDVAALPILPETRAICDHFGIDPLGLLGSGALLMAASPDATPGVMARLRESWIAVTRIGRIVGKDEGCVLVGAAGDRAPLPWFVSDEVTRVL